MSSRLTGGKLSKDKYSGVFCDIQEEMDLTQAQIESNRCYYCYDAPCIQACPTEIDIPSFIRKISNGNTKGAALDILSANIMGGTCARVCPVETLCQQACVRNDADDRPVEIGRLQRFATDAYFGGVQAKGGADFKRAPLSGHKVAVVGAGPAGFSCAHRLAMLGHDVDLFEARPKAGGLNEYGIAPYKVADQWAQREIEFLLGVGGITLHTGKALGRDFSVEDLRKKYSNVFLGLGLGGSNRLGIPGEDLEGVFEAAKFIEGIRQAPDLSKIAIGDHVVVIGGGNTAIDIAIQAKRLGADTVTLVYRRGQDQMGATPHEQELAQKNGVLIKPWAKPVQLQASIVDPKQVGSIEFERTVLKGDRLEGTGNRFTLQADQVFKAIGQTFLENVFSKEKECPKMSKGKIDVSQNFETSLAGVFAGGDCIARGEDLTVTSVQHGKLAAIAIDQRLQKGAKNHG